MTLIPPLQRDRACYSCGGRPALFRVHHFDRVSCVPSFRQICFTCRYDSIKGYRHETVLCTECDNLSRWETPEAGPRCGLHWPEPQDPQVLHEPGRGEDLESPPAPKPSLIDRGDEEAIKHDYEKLPLSLLPPESLEEVARVLQYGAIKYEAHNWRKGMEHSRLIDAALRHLMAYIKGEDIDPESSLPHLAHATCSLLFLISYRLTNIGIDDRYQKETL